MVNFGKMITFVPIFLYLWAQNRRCLVDRNKTSIDRNNHKKRKTLVCGVEVFEEEPVNYTSRQKGCID